MRARSFRGCLVCATALCLVCTPALVQSFPEKGQSALEADPKAWIDLFPGKDLKGWKRVPIAPDTKLNAKNPWSISADGKTLLCDGEEVKEMLLYHRPFKDGIFHLEWRFRPLKDKKFGYNGGAYVRTAEDGKVWLQAQIAHQEKPPLAGDLFGDMLVGGRLKRVEILGKGHQRVRPPGEWNTFEITCKEKLISVWVNGEVATRWDTCEVPLGHVGLQAEYYFLEFRNLKFKALN
jgi:hypothetical protein